MDLIASFTVNHLLLEPGVYVSRQDADPSTGAVITTFDLRLTAPNREPVMDTAAVHALEHLGVEVRVQTALSMQQIAEPYIRNRAIRHLEKGRVIILACGTGNPFFSTDTASALRAAEINADIIFKATMVDGVYDKDPKKYADAKKYDTLTFSRVLADQLAVMDSTAATMCRDNSLPILVFDILHPENIAKAVAGEPIGTLVVEQ